MRELSAPERMLIANLERRIEEAARVLPDFATTCFGHLRTRSAREELDLFLGNQALLREQVSLIDWRHAPLAAVFFGAREGSRYEVESEGRLLEGILEAGDRRGASVVEELATFFVQEHQGRETGPALFPQERVVGVALDPRRDV